MSVRHNIYTFKNQYTAVGVVLANATKPFVRVTHEVVNSVFELNPVRAVGYLKLPISLVGSLRAGTLEVISIDEC